MDEPLRLVAESAPEEAQVVAEPISFEAFFDAEARTLFRRLCAVTGNSAEAEEIMQDAFLALWSGGTGSTRSRTRPRTCTGRP